MSELYGWTPRQIAALTPAQIVMYADPDRARTASGPVRRFGSKQQAAAAMRGGRP